VAPVFENGEKTATLRGDNIAAEFKIMLENYVAKTYHKQQQEAL
jgi:(E)-4-hydroxy-3-methylbut-2-enyl-diphosphate synthase